MIVKVIQATVRGRKPILRLCVILRGSFVRRGSRHDGYSTTLVECLVKGSFPTIMAMADAEKPSTSATLPVMDIRERARHFNDVVAGAAFCAGLDPTYIFRV